MREQVLSVSGCHRALDLCQEPLWRKSTPRLQCRRRSAGIAPWDCAGSALGLPPPVARPISACQRAIVSAPLNLPASGLLTEAIAILRRTACMQGHGRRDRIRISKRSVAPSKRVVCPPFTR
jgi:hypothetical protein